MGAEPPTIRWFGWRTGIPVIVAAIALAELVTTASAQSAGASAAPPAVAQSSPAIPLPRISPGRGGTLPNEGGPSQADLPPGSKNAVAGDDTGPPVAVSPFGDGLTGDDFDTATPFGGIDQSPDVGPPKDIRPGTYTLEARLTADGPALGTGVAWRVFGASPAPDGKLPLVNQSSGGVVYLKLDPGTYYIYASYGRAGSVKRITVSGPTGGQVVVLNAGGLRLLAINGKDLPLTASDVMFDIYAAEESGTTEGTPLVSTPPGRVVGLTAGFYHIVSRYGAANAKVRADIQIDAGKLTEATLYQKAARLTLKLVQAHGGEAVADTVWSVQTAAGETVLASSLGAFPSVVLAAGDYTAIARHAGQTYTQAFKVEAGADRDVEVLVN
jgi:hypothetical protein